ncbi:LOW QUALITY PROTEIN: hypothetical protein PoB_004527100 [Plakobranchus ocellatus]|uniref:Uncharacterized protein n=1 Tax=Plakobranchus ocellatus TaxID=259542 RepID=A0AAV4BIL4_9GAST|nr:LOW QUALITY PROTEIN: hypothetical protein PoB_004527100 [Plakobranchus ocellatus]
MRRNLHKKLVRSCALTDEQREVQPVYDEDHRHRQYSPELQESLEEAIIYILHYQFTHSAVFDTREDRSPVCSVCCRRDYSGERSLPRRENPRESRSRGKWRTPPRQDRPRQINSEEEGGNSIRQRPGSKAGPAQTKESARRQDGWFGQRPKIMMDDKLRMFASRFEC